MIARIFASFVCICAALNAAAAPVVFGDATPLDWSVRMARAEMARKGDRMFRDVNPETKWSYTTTLFGLSLQRLAARIGEPAMADYGARTATSFIDAQGVIAGYKSDDYNLDLVSPGKVMLLRWESGDHSPSLKTALTTLRDQLRTHPRTSEGGFWHKQRYPNQMWLDGLFMASPFLAHYGKTFDEPALFDDVANQIILMDRHAYDPKTGLWFHGWDEARSQPWADKTTGTSPSFWSRSIGWYAMSIVDSIDYLPSSHPDVARIHEILDRVADGIVRWQDPASGLWWQVTDQGAREGNYLEATGSAMFVYTLAKGIDRGYLSREKYLPALIKGYAGIIREFIRTGADGSVSLTRCCSVAGLGGTSGGRARNGSFDYYVSERIVDNDHKGVGPFISAGIELDRMLATPAIPAATGAKGWQDYAAVLARIKAPVFPDRDFPITDFGAKPDADNTAAIAAAIAACHAAGGGRVVVPPGEWSTGAVHLLDNVNLHVAKGATLRWSFDLSLYPVVFTRFEGTECMNYSPLIYARGRRNIAVTGEGTLDGGADRDTWWGWSDKKGPRPLKQSADRGLLNQMGRDGVPVAERVFGPGHFLRPSFIETVECENVLIEGVTLLRSPMWEVHPLLSRNVTVRGLTIESHGPNNDGCDPESCSDVLIEDCVFDTGDDCIAIKSGRNADGRRVGVPTENVIVRNCVMKDGHGGVVLGSECSGHIRNVFIENCTMDSEHLDRALRFKDNAVRGGILENVFMRDVKIGRVGEAVLTIDLLYEEGAKGPFRPVVRNVQLDRITATAAPRVLYIRGFEGAVIDDIRISDSVFSGLTAAEVVQHAGRITLDHVTTVPAKVVKSQNSVPAPAE
jgi:unsaturated rhamnogalacturonyl hydrolase